MSKISINQPLPKPESRQGSKRMRDIPGMVTDLGAYSDAIIRPDDVQLWKKGASGRKKRGSENLYLKKDNTTELQRIYPGLSKKDAKELDRHARRLTRGFNGEAVADQSVATGDAPPLWADRKTGREVSSVDWICRHYGNKTGDRATWNPEGMTRAVLGRIDPLLVETYAQHIRRRPEDDLGIATQQRSKATTAEEARERARTAAREGMRRTRAMSR
jgi:hypothetical protein